MPSTQPVRLKHPGAPHEAIAAFIALLEREQQALAQPHADTLEAIADEKQALVRAFQNLGTQFARSPALQADHELRQLVERAQHLNAFNSKLLALHRNFCDSRLQLLRGDQTTSALYRANGSLGH